MRIPVVAGAVALALGWAAGAPARAQQPGADTLFERREAMIPMRDGVQLFTVVLAPRHPARPLPLLLWRTPYGTAGFDRTARFWSGFRELIEDGSGGYIFVFQDMRGRYRSGGEFVMARPPRSAAQAVDESTDAWDTIDWLVKHVAGNNGRVGMLGISYPGFLTDVALLGPHPALRAVSPQATMGDVWMGDDFFHQGAFRLSYGLEYAWDMEASSDGSVTVSPGRYDTYDWYRAFPTLDSLARAVGAMRWPTWRRFVEHPAYDSAWQARSLPRVLRHTTVPTLTVGGWWDQEDIHGPQATYAAREATDTAHLNFLVEGPWFHGQWQRENGDSLGRVQFGSATGAYFRRELQAPWFAYWLKGEGSGRFPEARVFDAGARTWRSFDAWPPADARTMWLRLESGGRLVLEAPARTSGGAGEGGSGRASRPTEGDRQPSGAMPHSPALPLSRSAVFDEFTSDPANPVPYRPRPVERTYGPGSRWRQWMTEDQRFVEGRPDVLAWQTAPLEGDVVLAGRVLARLFAATSGSDADWVVKLIDVYPDTVPERPGMGGYQLMVAGEILRGRYRTSWEHPAPITPGAVLPYTVDLHSQAYTFRRGHRIMVQVQSSWFPLYDRNPQTFVPNIFRARASDFVAQRHRVYHGERTASRVEIQVLQ